MKKLLLFASAGLIMASCSDDFNVKSDNVVAEGNTTIHATYPAPVNSESGTRTEWQWSNNVPKYNWSVGDVLGVFPAEGSNNLNATFRFKGTEPAETGDFTGDLPLIGAGDVYAYYPYAKNTMLNTDNPSEPTLQVEITQYQNYNFSAGMPGTGGTTLTEGLNGSFSQEMAPAVAKGVVEEGADEFELTFKPVASYLGVPVVGNTPDGYYIKTLSMTIGDETGLYGTITVPLTDETFETEYPVIPLDQNQTNNTVLVMNCGTTGVKLDSENITWFWFVIPANVALNSTDGVEYKFYVNAANPANPQETELSFSVTRKTTGTSTTTKSNMYYRVADLDAENSNVPFTYTPKDLVIIETPGQFLEYAYLASTPASTYINKLDNYNTNASENNPYIYDKALKLKTPTAGYTEGNIDGINNAVVVNPIDLATLDLQDPNSPYFSMDEYGKLVFGSFMQETPSIVPIGGLYNFSLSGSGTTAPMISFTNGTLTVTGNGLFAGAENNLTNVKYLQFDNLTIAPSSQDLKVNSNMATVLGINATPSTGELISYNKVSLGSSISFSIPEGNQDVVKAVVNGQGSWKNGTPTTLPGVSPVEGMALVNYLWAPSKTDFSKNNYVLSNYNYIVASGNGAEYYVENSDQAEELIPLLKVGTQKLNSVCETYSVFDETTSYWTGTTGDKAVIGSAENLATVAQAKSNDTFEFGNYNIDLMGTYSDGVTHTYWWSYGQAVDVTTNSIVKTITGKAGTEATSTISNVYINGTTDGEAVASNNNLFTMFGSGSIVNNVNIQGVTIENVALTDAEGQTVENTPNQNAVIAVVSTYPAQGNNYIYVSDVTVNTTVAYGNAVGGLYYRAGNNTSDFLGRINAASFAWAESAPTGVEAGDVAGVYYAQASGVTYTLAYPSASKIEFDGNAFGVVNVTVNPTSGTTTTAGTTITVGEGYGFTVDKNKGLIGLNLLPAKGTNSSYTVNVIYDNVTYVYQYNGTIYDYIGILNGPSTAS